MPKRVLITDEAHAALERIAKRTGGSVAEAFHAAVAEHHARVVGGGEGESSGEVPRTGYTRAMDAAARAGAERPGAKEAAFDKLGDAASDDEPGEGASASSSTAPGASTRSPLHRWARDSRSRRTTR